MAEIRIRVNVILKVRIKMFAKERGISINDVCIELLESGVLKILEMELGNEKIKSEQIDCKCYCKLWNGANCCI